MVSRRRNPFGTILAILRERLGDGLYAPGAPLAIVDLAEEFEFSTTPIREALAWLAGEHLIEERRGYGFSCWRMELDQLLSLYDLHETYLLLALRTLGPRHEFAFALENGAVSPATDLIRRTARAFARIVAASGNLPLFQAHSSLTARMGNVRRAEIEVLPDGRAELERCEASDWDVASLTALVVDYHQVRRAKAAEIFRCMVSSKIYSHM